MHEEEYVRSRLSDLCELYATIRIGAVPTENHQLPGHALDALRRFLPITTIEYMHHNHRVRLNMHTILHEYE